MANSQLNDGKNFIKAAQLHVFCKDQFNGDDYIERILQKEVDINCDMKKCRNVSENNSKNFSLLHSAYNRHYYSLKAYKLFINHGADYTSTDGENQTIVHRAVHDYHNHNPEDLQELPICVSTILSRHIQFNNISNPRSKYGISHLHAACMANHLGAVEFYLTNGFDVDETVNEDSPIFAGFTALHFAATYLNFEVAKILLNYGAGVQLINGAGMTPMHVLMERKINDRNAKETTDYAREKIIKRLMTFNEENVEDFGFISNFHIACLFKDTSVLESISEDELINVNQAVNVDSPFYPGYTALHFAAVCSNVDVVKFLLKNGADIQAKDANNVTPFDILLKNQMMPILCIIASQTEWIEIMLSDNETGLDDLIAEMNCDDDFDEYLSNIKSITEIIIPMDSPLWPGYTTLHLAVILVRKSNEKDLSEWVYERNMVGKLLARGADVTKKDANNATAIHLAFYLEKRHAARSLLKHHLTIENPIDNNNLSHFHIACAVGDESAVKRFLSNKNIDINLPIESTINWHTVHTFQKRQFFLTPGSTALHISVACGNVEITKILLGNGADIYAKDCNGFTPIHRLFTIPLFDNSDKHMELLCSRDETLHDSIANCGLSHLHVACYLGPHSAVEKLLDCGADVNAVVTYKATKYVDEGNVCLLDPYGDPAKETFSFLSHYNDSTALHFAIHNRDQRIRILLLQRGVQFGNCKCVVKLDESEVLQYLVRNDDSSDNLKVKLGISSLHVACYEKKRQLMEKLLLRKENVNANSSISPGNTPLHVAIEYSQNIDDSAETIELLLKNGADVTLKNDNGVTALDLLHRKYTEEFADCKSAHFLLKSIKDFDISNVDSQGISFFHYACMLKNVEMVEKFLEYKIDVNKPVDYLADKYPGCTPLHFAAAAPTKSLEDVNSKLRVIDLLLKHGADVCIIDIFENTPVHCAASCGSSREIIFDRLIRNGVDVNAVNIHGKTALEILIKSKSSNWEEVQCLLKHGSHYVKFYNPINQKRYIDKLFNGSDEPNFRFFVIDSDDEDTMNDNVIDNEVLRNLKDSEYVTRIDLDGRNFLQNLIYLEHVNVSEYVELIRQFVKRACDINHRDNEGKTVLHLAIRFQHKQSIVALLKNGADVNITDNEGKTAFAYCSEYLRGCYANADSIEVVNTFAMHFHKMKRSGLYISEMNRQLEIDVINMYTLKERVLNRFENDIERTNSIKVGSTDFTLYDFGFIRNAEMIYPSMSLAQRLEIDEFFENIRQYNLHELDYLLKIKYEKARERLRLINLSIEPFSILIKDQLPELCCRIILSFLSAADLRNVAATAEDSIRSSLL